MKNAEHGPRNAQPPVDFIGKHRAGIFNAPASQTNLEQPTGRVAAEGNDGRQQADPGATADAGATEAGGPTQEANGQVNEPGSEYSVRQQFSLFGDEQGDQLQLFIDSKPAAGQDGAGGIAAKKESVAALADLHSTASILAKALSSDYAARQRVSLVGQKVASAEDLAVLNGTGSPVNRGTHVRSHYILRGKGYYLQTERGTGRTLEKKKPSKLAARCRGP